jgi:hypothetical protein
MEVSRRAVLTTVMAFAGLLLTARAARAIDATAIETDLAITIDGVEQRAGSATRSASSRCRRRASR